MLILTFLFCAFKRLLPETVKSRVRPLETAWLFISKPFGGMTLRHCLSLQDFIYNFKVISNELWLRRKKGKNNHFPMSALPPANIHTQTYMLQMGKMFKIEAGSNYSGWNGARILVIGFSLFPPQFLFFSLLSSFPNHQVGGWVAGWLMVGKQK